MEARRPDGWGMENYPFPKGPAFIEVYELKCTGCGICQMACSMKHFGVISKDLSRIQVRKYLLPLPKAIPSVCQQCAEEERACQKACPVKPPAIYFDPNTLHMVINKETCLGHGCRLCRRACGIDVIRVYPSVSRTPFVCDLCDTENTGNRNPECVNVCPYGALYFSKSAELRFGYAVQDLFRKHPDEKAEMMARRLYPLPKNSMGYPGWR